MMWLCYKWRSKLVLGAATTSWMGTCICALPLCTWPRMDIVDVHGIWPDPIGYDAMPWDLDPSMKMQLLRSLHPPFQKDRSQKELAPRLWGHLDVLALNVSHLWKRSMQRVSFWISSLTQVTSRATPSSQVCGACNGSLAEMMRGPVSSVMLLQQL